MYSMIPIMGGKSTQPLEHSGKNKLRRTKYHFTLTRLPKRNTNVYTHLLRRQIYDKARQIDTIHIKFGAMVTPLGKKKGK